MENYLKSAAAGYYLGDPSQFEAFVTRVKEECDKAWLTCTTDYHTLQSVTRAERLLCTAEQLKYGILKQFPDNKEAAGRIFDEYLKKRPIPHLALKGGKRRRRTMHRKRSHKKNSSRRNRRVRQ